MSNLNLELVYVNNAAPTTDSSILATYFKKRHADVLAKIEKQLTEYSVEFTSANFSVDVQLIEGPNGATRESKIFRMTRNGAMAVGVTMTGKKAAEFREAIIKAFDLMEQKLHLQSRPKDPLEMLEQAFFGWKQERTLRLVAETARDEEVVAHVQTKLTTVLGNAERAQLDRAIAARTSILLPSFPDKSKYNLTSVIKRIIRAVWARPGHTGSYKEIDKAHLGDAIAFLSAVDVAIVDVCWGIPNTTEGRDSIRKLLKRK